MKIKKFNQLNISKQLIFSYIGITIIPIVFLSAIIYNYSKKSLESKVTNSFQIVNSQITINLDNFFKNIAKLSETTFYDENIQGILSRDYSKLEHGEFQRIQDNFKITDYYFRNYFLINDYIYSLDLYPTKKEFIYSKGYNQSINYEYSPKNEEWFKNIIKADGKEVILGIHQNLQVNPHEHYVVSVGRCIKNPFKNDLLGVFLINIKVDELKGLYEQVNLTPNSQQLIVDEHNNIVYSSKNEEIGQHISKELEQYIMCGSIITEGMLGKEKAYIVTNTSKYTDWKVVSIISTKELFSDITAMKDMVILFGIILTILVTVISLFISRDISKPIKQLSSTMKKFEYGSLDETVDVYGNEEIVYLSKTYNKMLGKIKELIGQIRIEEEEKRIVELNALQSKINPHFMYNTLNVVKLMAEMQGADNITKALNSFIALLTFSANTDETFISIEEEFEFLEKYIDLLKLRYYNRFYVEYDIDEKVYKYKTIKFLIQPFVENAVFHGFNSKGKTHFVRVEAKLEGNTVIFNIIDNGSGMSEEIINKAMTSKIQKKKGFNSIGINNIVNRIRLHFGSEDGVKIESVIGEGTRVRIKIPAIIEERRKL
ncbi:cache domain-containing sensor histidine kinase [Clostridium ganghwense]|uniref:Sensor histidine kinase n=1 Tax=Clostridium ganghwense TaxID=312089 RepID=A0ABT4CKE0_9CLOT|nr:sensor histidine kinase [Clostridium ganghwense]MCY6369522.1 sensor histidine kinase [Clostridium ganghwense]